MLVTIPHTAFILTRFEAPDWWLLAWSLAAAVDIGIAYGGAVSADIRTDKEARHWATALFAGLSIGSYCLNVAHYVVFGADWWSIGLGAFFPIGILFLAKVKARLLSASYLPEPAPAQPIDGIVMTDADITRLKQEAGQAVEAHYRQYIQERDKALSEARSELDKARHLLNQPRLQPRPKFDRTRFLEIMADMARHKFNREGALDEMERAFNRAFEEEVA